MECVRSTKLAARRSQPSNHFSFDTPTAPDRCDNAELGEVHPNRISHRGPLADEHMAGAMKHQATLLLGRFSRHEPHVGPGDRLTNRLCVVLHRASSKLVASAARYGQLPASRATNSGTTHKPRCQPCMKANSGKTPAPGDASTGADQRPPASKAARRRSIASPAFVEISLGAKIA
jgi:hypothetical protein